MKKEQTKTCTKCGKEKSLDEFHNGKSRKDGHQAQCKNCSKLYRLNHKEYFKAYAVKYWKDNREYFKACSAKYRITHRKQLNACSRKYRKNNKIHYNKIMRKRKTNERITLHNSYIKRMLCQKTTLKCTDIPIELVEVKREHVKLSRKLREGFKNEHNERSKRKTG